MAELLEGGLTSQEAVQVALLNNRGLQESLFEIGVQRADAVQAGLLSNPSLEALVRFPVDGGNHEQQRGGSFRIVIELWHLPVRKQVAESQVERTVLNVAQQRRHRGRAGQGGLLQCPCFELCPLCCRGQSRDGSGLPGAHA